ncbi:MAG: sulfatase-like hydrolase/transferase [Phycisphaera sp.]|nr:sulfatase-like hydrolase/transferase [Phycisphaera sp.]
MIVLASLLLACPLVSRSAQAADKPNIIWLMADDLGWGDPACFGGKKIATPGLDRMAAEGMKLTQFYAGNTVCAPSRCVLMTGQHLGHTWVRGNGGGAAQALRDEDVTVAEKLKEAGYTTALVGKWGLGDVGAGEAGLPNKQGFDYFFGYLSQVHAHYYYTTYLWRNEEKFDLPGNHDGKREQYTHDVIEAEALHWVKENKDKPFFLYLALTAPHAEVLAPKDAMAPYEGKWPEKPYVNNKPYGNGYATSPTPRASFAGMVSRMDRTVDRMMQLLRDLKIDKNTLIIFTSDNGPHHEGGADPDFFDSNGPFRGYKRDLTEGGIREPTIAWWPGTIKAGSESDHMGYFGDFMATACELAHVDPPGPIDSISFLPTLLGHPEKQKKHDYLYWEFYEQGSKQAVRFGDWKAIRKPMFTGDIELYDLSKDIGEEHDLAKDHADIVKQAEKLMAEAHVDNPNWKVRGQAPKKSGK